MLGVMARPAHPVCLGASGGLTLGMDPPDMVTWNAEKRMLKGAVSTPRGADRAHIYVPAGWQLDSATVGGGRLRGITPSNGVLTFEIGGASTGFTFEFSGQ